jgi:hypothetical protein
MVKVYGRWCGPNWTNNQNIAARDYLLSGGSFKTKCKDKLDCACRSHDKACASSKKGCSASADTELIRVADAIASNPLYFFTNPKMYAAAFIVRDGIKVARLTRRH